MAVNKKIISLVGVVSISSVLCGCDPEGSVFVQGTEDGISDWQIGLAIPFSQNDPQTIFDAGAASVDLSGSNIPISSTGSVLVKLYESGSLEAAQTFGSTIQMDQVVFSSPSSVNAFFDGHAESFDEVKVEFQVSTSATVAENTVVAEFKNDQDVVTGASASVYIDECDLGGGSMQQPPDGLTCN